jgi:uncharacterized protein (DUF1330 family)
MFSFQDDLNLDYSFFKMMYQRYRAFSLPMNERSIDMAKGYWIVRVSVHNAAEYPSYLAAARPAFEKFGARFLVRGGAAECMEGVARERNVVVEFADVATASACYQSEEYGLAKAIRQRVADADFVIVEGA